MSEAAPSITAPEPGSAAELAIFRDLQLRLPDLFRKVFPDPRAPRTVVIIPSLSLDQDVMARVTGAHHYEERMLCMLMLLKMPRTRVIYVTSQPVSEEIIDYYLHLLPGIPATHARQRLSLFSCFEFDAQTTGGQDPGATAIARSAPRCDSGDRDGAYVVLQRIGARTHLGRTAWHPDLWLRSSAAPAWIEKRGAGDLSRGRGLAASRC